MVFLTKNNKVIVQDIMFLLYYCIDNMNANKVSDFYDNLGKKSKKEIDRFINKLYVTNK